MLSFSPLSANVSDLCSEIEPFLSLILPPNQSVEYLTKFSTFASLLPPFSATLSGLEIALNDNQACPDLLFGIPLPHPPLTLSPEFKDHTVWNKLMLFLNSCQETHLFHRHQLSRMWIEFDLGSSPSWPPLPNLWFVSDRCNNVCDCISEITSLLSGQSVPINRLSDDSKGLRIKHIGWMLARQTNKVKINLVNGSTFDPKFLQEHFRNPDTRLLNLLNNLQPYCQSHQIQTNFSPLSQESETSFGLEFHMPIDIGLQQQRDTWQRVFELLLNDGLMTYEVIDRLNQWIGHTSEPDHFLIRYISHVKLVHGPQQPLKAKIYLGFFRRTKSLL